MPGTVSMPPARTDPTSRDAIARVARTERPAGLWVSVEAHLIAKGGKACEAFAQAGFVTMAEAGG